jgi:hypothetical protein
MPVVREVKFTKHQCNGIGSVPRAKPSHIAFFNFLREQDGMLLSACEFGFKKPIHSQVEAYHPHSIAYKVPQAQHLQH